VNETLVRKAFRLATVRALWQSRRTEIRYWEIIGDNLSKAGWSWGCVAAVTIEGRIIWVADAHRDDGKRFVVHADEKLTVFRHRIGDSHLWRIGLTT
jgi:hypothetical protein